MTHKHHGADLREIYKDRRDKTLDVSGARRAAAAG